MIWALSLPLLGILALDKGTTPSACHALFKSRLEALKLNYLVAGLIK
jgi:hypothetical protein